MAVSTNSAQLRALCSVNTSSMFWHWCLIRLRNTAQVAPVPQPQSWRVLTRDLSVYLGWEVHEVHDTDEVIMFKKCSILHMSLNFHLQDVFFSYTLLWVHIVPVCLNWHSWEYKSPPIPQVHCPTLASDIVFACGLSQSQFPCNLSGDHSTAVKYGLRC